jgi:hypothetical protein
MRQIDRRIAMAHTDAARFSGTLLVNVGLCWCLLCAGLAALTYLGVNLRWIVTLGFAAGVPLVCGMIAAVSRRLIASCSYTEQCIRDIDSRVADGAPRP